MDTDDRMERLEVRLDAQQRQIDALLAENERLRASVQPSAPEPAHRPDDARPDDGRPEVVGPGLGRRRLLIGGATAGVAAAAALVGTAAPAAADNGDALAIGQTDNAATATTALAAVVADGNPAMSVTLTGDGRAVEGVALGSGFGVYGVGGTGVNGAGVYGGGTTGVGVWGASTSEAGVYGESSSNTGTFGVSTTGGGAYGVSNSGPGVYGQSVTSSAVRGLSVSALGVEGVGGTIGVSAAGPGANLFLPVHDGTRAAPTSDVIAHVRGEVLTDVGGNQWVCVADGTPGTWRKTAGPATAGQFHVLPAPARVYDSRSGTFPSQGPKTPLSGNVARPIDCTHNSSGVPLGATAVALTVLLVNAFNGNGNMTIWANGAAKPQANTAVWGTGSGRYTTSTISALDGAAKLQIAASANTDVVLDIIGYYR